MTIQLYDLAGREDHWRFSPFCWRIRMALAHKELPVEALPWRFTETERLAFSGQSKVPVIRDGERVVSDSWAIAEYLEDGYPDRPALFPGGDRSQTLFVKHWVERVIHPLVARMIVADLPAILHDCDVAYFVTSRESRLGKTLGEVSADRDTVRPQFRDALAPLRRTLATHPFLGGTMPGFGDFLVFGALQWARCSSAYPLLERDDPVYAWRDRLLDRFDGLARAAPALDTA